MPPTNTSGIKRLLSEKIHLVFDAIELMWHELRYLRRILNALDYANTNMEK